MEKIRQFINEYEKELIEELIKNKIEIQKIEENKFYYISLEEESINNIDILVLENPETINYKYKRINSFKGILHDLNVGKYIFLLRKQNKF
jgi:hypothetical protein